MFSSAGFVFLVKDASPILLLPASSDVSALLVSLVLIPTPKKQLVGDPNSSGKKPIVAGSRCNKSCSLENISNNIEQRLVARGIISKVFQFPIGFRNVVTIGWMTNLLWGHIFQKQVSPHQKLFMHGAGSKFVASFHISKNQSSSNLALVHEADIRRRTSTPRPSSARPTNSLA